jgi:hypothetical protein
MFLFNKVEPMLTLDKVILRDKIILYETAIPSVFAGLIVGLLQREFHVCLKYGIINYVLVLVCIK